MPRGTKMIVRDYINQLKQTKKDKPEQIRDALEIYMELWENVIKNGTVSEEDPVEDALSKIDKAGGLYRAAE